MRRQLVFNEQHCMRSTSEATLALRRFNRECPSLLAERTEMPPLLSTVSEGHRTSEEFAFNAEARNDPGPG